MNILLLVGPLAEKVAEKAVEASVGKSVEVATTKVIGKSNTALLSSIVTCFGLGFLIGYGCRKFLKPTLAVLAISIVSIVLLDTFEVINVDWDAVFGLARQAQKEAGQQFNDTVAVRSFFALLIYSIQSIFDVIGWGMTCITNIKDALNGVSRVDIHKEDVNEKL